VAEGIRVNLLNLRPIDADALPVTCLSAAEISRAATFRRVADRNRFVAGRRLLRSLAAVVTSSSPGDVDLQVTAGRVRIRDRPDVHVSITHSGEWVGCVIAGRPVGLDVEQEVTEAPDPVLLRRTCTAAEREVLAASTDPTADFTRIWVRKEALGKATDRGLDLPLTDIDVRSGVAVLPAAGHWAIHDLPVAPGYHAAVAAQGESWAAEVKVLVTVP
jgi:4'-phosphopantetheinyl transferase